MVEATRIVPASSMQSPPASSEWTRVIAWIPTFARPAALLGPDVSVASYKLRERPDGTACSWAPSATPTLPRPFYRWHLDSGLALVVYLVVHVWRRRKRLRRSTIR